jgi:hexosaminidase
MITMLLLLGMASAPPTHDLMPVPAQIVWQSGGLPVDARFAMALAGRCDARVEAALKRTAARLEALLGQRLVEHLRPGGKAALVVECAEPGLPVQALGEDESHRLEVTAKGARLTARTSLGALRGLETFLQLARRDGSGIVVPAVTIEDRPRFAWRGLLIDACRHWMPPEVIRRTLDGMAAVKLNVLHWHLTEDQGFRVESRLHPKLHLSGSDGQFYTQDQVREILAYSRERGIRVVPEFDVPGHATAWLVGHPELASAPGPYAIERKWGVFDPTLDPSREEVYAFLDSFLGEMAALFPDAYLHIGGDEVSGRHWNQSATIQAFMYGKGLRDNEALQAHFNNRVSAIVKRHGKRMVGWDEVLHEDLEKGSVVHSWRGAEGLAEASRRGYDAILSHGYYLDHMLPAAQHYAVDPLPAEAKLSEAERARVLGGEACMWAEFVTPETIDSRVWPRAAAIAERLWSPGTQRDVEDMYRRLAAESERLSALGLTHRSGYEPMLKRIAAGGPVEALRVLADAVEPVKFYGRGRTRAYTQQTPLDRLVDAAWPESESARLFRRDVDRFLLAGPGFPEARELRAALEAWARSHVTLDAQLAAVPSAAEIRPVSRCLSAVAEVGLQALAALASRQKPEPAWGEKTQRALADARQPRAEVEIAILPAVRKLALAAERQDRLASMSAAEWVKALDTELAPAPRRRE